MSCTSLKAAAHGAFALPIVTLLPPDIYYWWSTQPAALSAVATRLMLRTHTQRDPDDEFSRSLYLAAGPDALARLMASPFPAVSRVRLVCQRASALHYDLPALLWHVALPQLSALELHELGWLGHASVQAFRSAVAGQSASPAWR